MNQIITVFLKILWKEALTYTDLRILVKLGFKGKRHKQAEEIYLHYND